MPTTTSTAILCNANSNRTGKEEYLLCETFSHPHYCWMFEPSRAPGPRKVRRSRSPHFCCPFVLFPQEVIHAGLLTGGLQWRSDFNFKTPKSGAVMPMMLSDDFAHSGCCPVLHADIYHIHVSNHFSIFPSPLIQILSEPSRVHASFTIIVNKY